MTDSIQSDGQRNARYKLEDITAYRRALADLKGGEEVVYIEGERFEDVKAVEAVLQELPIEVLVRGPWHSPHGIDDAASPNELQIVLTIGGPACRIHCKLDSSSGEPYDPVLQYKDGFNSWLDLCQIEEADVETLEWFARRMLI